MQHRESLRNAIVWIGGIALLGATAVDTLAVIGRHIGLPLSGSIEIMQALVLVAGATSLVISTLAGAHARVRLILDRMPAKMRLASDLFGDLLSLMFFLMLLGGSAWIASDLWAGHEQSEVLGLPWRWLRVFVNISLIGCCMALLSRSDRRVR